MQNNTNTQQFTSWINNASPDDLVLIGKQVLVKIGTLPSDYQARFGDYVRGNRDIAKLFDVTNA